MLSLFFRRRLYLAESVCGVSAKYKRDRAVSWCNITISPRCIFNLNFKMRINHLLPVFTQTASILHIFHSLPSILQLLSLIPFLLCPFLPPLSPSLTLSSLPVSLSALPSFSLLIYWVVILPAWLC